MSNMTKNVLLIGGTAIATTVAIDLFTGGAVRAAFSEKMADWQNRGGAGAVMADGVAGAAEAVSNGAAAVADAING